MNAYTIQYDDGFWQDIKNVINWYDAISPNIGNSFLEEFWFAESRIADNPNAFSKVTHSGFRRVLLKKSPYKIYFKVKDNSFYCGTYSFCPFKKIRQEKIEIIGF